MIEFATLLETVTGCTPITAHEAEFVKPLLQQYATSPLVQDDLGWGRAIEWEAMRGGSLFSTAKAIAENRGDSRIRDWFKEEEMTKASLEDKNKGRICRFDDRDDLNKWRIERYSVEFDQYLVRRVAGWEGMLYGWIDAGKVKLLPDWEA